MTECWKEKMWRCYGKVVPMRSVKVIVDGGYVEDHWRLGKLRNKSQVSG